MLERQTYIAAIGGKKEVAVESGDITIRTIATAERSAGNIQTVVTNRVENPQPSIGAIAREKDHLNARGLDEFIEIKQFVHKTESIARSKWLVLVGDLILLISLEALLFKDLMALAEIEQGARRNRDH